MISKLLENTKFNLILLTIIFIFHFSITTRKV